ncbi:hypothetical protein NVP1152O_104 [Vibrio phage 1.152.O._10N.222.46.E1]|uniref:Uncharacterized protein n=5 Tax=Nahantvirus 49C7 TaxID=2846601 RepID=A0A2I7RBH5_9CAUD|nr:hypothetical protein HYP57_gp082 [Vibrio phage 1.026.O._10N.222.49.C7]AUR82586.1 hypothetical protein NVP1025O_103 [Vibrio phage 1.025.O._10N.222.46.B6]AUR90836.1 hypothetical protein NVP1150O_103 [Vibrio phage 1.150.O._10N.222.46.A6]AUR91009.1 hypothetical protein NVP1152O_104 [Vibrio phage 1.152.O._10N.222.46.E1]AUS02477.1 hypothetical protein NVP2130O_103 [Vibrio phage 2.130.O._10N.222.46.C2]AUR82694.1 hypothetical protein NVP1026O_103 [Vibrio phage 1.026.O._10N.222.49.C7]
MNISPKVIRMTNQANQSVRVQSLRNGSITVSVYGVGGDTAQSGNQKQLTAVCRKFGMTKKSVLEALQD